MGCSCRICERGSQQRKTGRGLGAGRPAPSPLPAHPSGFCLTAPSRMVDNTLERTFDRTIMPLLEATCKRTPSFDSKRQCLLSAAARVFAGEGYDRVSMRQIAVEAWFSLVGVYHYVAGKEELLYWIQLDTFESLLRGLQNSLEEITDPRERLRAAVRNHVHHFGEHMQELKVCAEELDTLDGKAYEEVYNRRRAYFEAVHALVKELQPRHDTHLGSWLATANLFGMLNWFYQWYRPERSSVSLDELAAEQASLFLGGYAAPATKRESTHEVCGDRVQS